MHRGGGGRFLLFRLSFWFYPVPGYAQFDTRFAQVPAGGPHKGGGGAVRSFFPANPNLQASEQQGVVERPPD